jgi:hypothetical protein
MKGRAELGRRVTVMVGIAVAVSLTLASNLSDAANTVAALESDAIGGTGVDAIGGTGRTLKRTGDAIGGTGADAIGTTAKTRNVLLRGPVQRVNLAANTVMVLGREFRLASDGTRSIHDALAAGETVALTISGRLGRNGELLFGKARIDQEQYVAGSSQVILAGRVQLLDQLVARAVIGKQVVDLTTLQTTALSPRVKTGDVVVVVGTQPSLNGEVSAQILSPAD